MQLNETEINADKFHGNDKFSIIPVIIRLVRGSNMEIRSDREFSWEICKQIRAHSLTNTGGINKHYRQNPLNKYCN